MSRGLAGGEEFENDHSFAGAAAVDDAVGAGAIWTGAAAAGGRFGAGGFLAAASAGEAVADGVAAGGRGTGAPAAAADGTARLGSGVMMLTGGIEAELGKSAVVGLPVGIDGGSAATTPGASAACGGAFHDGA
jgi:type V secretory pathway adhesin AidA